MGRSDGDIPVPGDYDGDGTTDIAIYRPSEGVWYVQDQRPSCSGAVRQATSPCPATTTATARPTSPSTVPRRASGTSRTSFPSCSGEVAGDVPVPGDYNGNGTTDIAIYRPSEGVWYVKNQGPFVQWGGLAVTSRSSSRLRFG